VRTGLGVWGIEYRIKITSKTRFRNWNGAHVARPGVGGIVWLMYLSPSGGLLSGRKATSGFDGASNVVGSSDS
jgi:hypothetical protein